MSAAAVCEHGFAVEVCPETLSEEVLAGMAFMRRHAFDYAVDVARLDGETAERYAAEQALDVALLGEVPERDHRREIERFLGQ